MRTYAFCQPILAMILLTAGCSDSTEVVQSPQGAGGTAGVAGSAGTGAGGSGGSSGSAGNVIGPGGGGSGGSAGSAGNGGTGAKPLVGCGDGVISAGEACDDGNSDPGDGCSADCSTIEANFACPNPGSLCVSTVVCGDGKISGTETCDDGNQNASDGCSASCTVESGWVCPVPDARCEAAACGDSIVAGKEQCDDGNAGPTDGCDDNCQLEPGFACPDPGQPCHATTCGDGVSEGTEQCDDGNHDMGDGCTPFCIREPNCSQGACTSVCGDGIRLAGDVEECEDGNTQPGDGCSPDCHIEPGFTCTPNNTIPQTIELPLVLRDFQISHPDFEDFNCGQLDGILEPSLNAAGKPVAASPPTCISSVDSFAQWYSDVPQTNFTLLQTLSLSLQPDNTYQYDNSSFFPLDNQGWGNEGNNHNFHFTSEVRYYFEYKGGERLDFRGDDDVWVFANRKLAVDLGGVHGAVSGFVILGDSDGNGTYSATEQAETTDPRFDLVKGKVYELVVFQAERHTTQSNYRLTLGNFLNSATVCVSDCGDGIVTPDEVCDDGVNDGSYGSCTPDCKRAAYCGDGMLQPDHEICDDGVNLTPYSPTGTGCAPGCKLPSKCGDEVVDAVFGETCDLGAANNTGAYGGCNANCTLAPRCGDGIIQNGEQCDDGNALSNDGCSSTCLSELQLSPNPRLQWQSNSPAQEDAGELD